MEIKDGGPAFPCIRPVMQPSDRVKGALEMVGEKMHDGLTIRDYFAGQALIGILSGKYGEVQDSLSDKSYKDAVAKVAYEFSDAMLTSRQGEGK